MNWLQTFKEELTCVFAESEQIISQFPPPLHEKGLSYLKQFNIFQENSAKNYICYLLPYWMRDLTKLSVEDCRKLSVGNVFGMLYFFIQDDLMDSDSSSCKDKLPLGNLLYLQFQEIYRSLFPTDSPLWSYFRQYVYEWTDSVGNENERDYFFENKLMIARKAAPLKLSSTGALLLSNQAALIPKVNDLVDHVLITLQLADDWTDWPEDLQDGSYNCLISLIRKQMSPDDILSESTVRHYVTLHDVLNDYSQTAVFNQQHIEELQLPLPYLISFHEYLLNNILSDAANIELERNSLLNGGLYHWMQLNIKK